MKTGSWFNDRLYWGVLAGGVALVAVLRAWLGPGTIPARGVLVMVILVYPPLEEFVFRGMIQPALARRIPAWRQAWISPANALTSLLFALAHLPVHSLSHSALVFWPSLAFGLFRDRHGTIASPVVLHMSWNAAFILLLGQSVSPF